MSKLRVVTNHDKLKEFYFTSDRSNPTRYFVFNNFISGIFRFLCFQRRFTRQQQFKYFSIVRRHLVEQYRAIHCRLQRSVRNNNQTRTFFHFSVDKEVYYFRFYLPCCSTSCQLPPAFVTRHGPRCWVHWKELCQSSTPVPLSGPPCPPNSTKSVTSHRLGISYTKEVHPLQQSDHLLVNYRNLISLPTSTDKQRLRFERLTRSPTSNHFDKLLTFNKHSISIVCKYTRIVPRRLAVLAPLAGSLYSFVPDVAVSISPVQLRLDPVARRHLEPSCPRIRIPEQPTRGWPLRR